MLSSLRIKQIKFYDIVLTAGDVGIAAVASNWCIGFGVLVTVLQTGLGGVAVK